MAELVECWPAELLIELTQIELEQAHVGLQCC